MAYTTIDDPSAYFKVQLYTGTGDTQSITFNDTDTDMQPDLLWQKSRSHSQDPRIFDAVRGGSKMLYPSLNNVEESDAQFITAFGSDGFTMGTAGGNANDSGTTYVAWCWKESATAGFDIVAYDGVGVGTAQNVSHSLSAVPEFYTVKSRESEGNWQTYHHLMSAAPETDYIQLDSNGAVEDYTFWGDTAPTSSVFTVDDGNDVNESGEGFLCYLWRSVQGFSKFGTYIGTGDADGPFVYTGFRPAMVIAKRTDSTGYWRMRDNKRTPYNVIDKVLRPDTNEAEITEDNHDFLSNGFKVRTSGIENNADGGTYIYIAFAEAPLVNSNGVPCNAR